MLARTVKISGAILSLSAAAPVLAETLAVDGQVTVKPANVETPKRGSSMESVEARFGAPANKAGPVGTPAINKWFYPNFVVVFENEKVLHAVVGSG